MSKETAKAKVLVPNLRFPEFQDAGEWNNISLGEMYFFKVTNSFTRDKLNYGKGSVKNIHYGDIHTKFSTLFNIRDEIVPFVNVSQSIEKIKSDNYCSEGDIVFADASEDLNDVGKSIEIVNVNNEKLLSGLHTLHACQKAKKLIVGFGGYLFKSNGIRNQIKKEAQGTKVSGISAGRLSSINIYYPRDKEEQQKIADCLTSIDELITAQNQKLGSFKAHKKGLMQQLFPAEGETVPKLRFPEFRGAWEWKKKILGDIAEKKSSTIAANAISESCGDYKVYGAAGYLQNVNFYKEKKPYIAIVKDGAGVGRTFLCEAQTSVLGTLDIIKSKNDNNLKFLYSLVNRINFDKYIIGSTIPHIYFKDYSKEKINIPCLLEQQKIADCLSSIDALITSQAQKLGALKAHKKGLMQQLFPTTGEVNG